MLFTPFLALLPVIVFSHPAVTGEADGGALHYLERHTEGSVSESHMVNKRLLEGLSLNAKYARGDDAKVAHWNKKIRSLNYQFDKIFKRQDAANGGSYNPGSTSTLLDNGRDLWYGLRFTIGSSKQAFVGQIDTGSDLLWLGDPKFDTTKSTTWVDGKRKVSLTYGSGNVGVSGTYGNDSVSVAGLTAKSFTFGVINATTGPQGGIPALIGMSWPYKSPTTGEITALPWWMAYSQQNYIRKSYFSLWLARQTTFLDIGRSDVNSNGGLLGIGTYEHSFMDGDIEWLPATGENVFWQTYLKAFTINGVSLPVDPARNKVIIDSGAAAWYAPPDVVSAYYAVIHGAMAIYGAGGSRQWYVPCTAEPKVSVTFGSVAYDAYSVDQIMVGPKRCLGFLADSHDGDYLFGDVFMKGVYTFFQWAPQTKIGFAKLNNCANKPVNPDVIDSLKAKQTLPAPAGAAAPTAT